MPLIERTAPDELSVGAGSGCQRSILFFEPLIATAAESISRTEFAGHEHLGHRRTRHHTDRKLRGRAVARAVSKYRKARFRPPVRRRRTSYGSPIHLQLDLNGMGVCGVRLRRVLEVDRGLDCAIDGSRYTSVLFTETLALQGVSASIGSVGDACGNALAESIIDLFKAEVVRRHGAFRTVTDVEFALHRRTHTVNDASTMFCTDTGTLAHLTRLP